eukprot:TRINITY_DN9433_c0_g1_i1.p1 TRINITY_DN9433_c0_g1~~TRINITY_DN9433_c0_g1_i1.p1  ORF type:complete len:345 (-),score=41.41 TRINITY_DN9433_c0_g1_i1:157-1191(-)
MGNLSNSQKEIKEKPEFGAKWIRFSSLLQTISERSLPPPPPPKSSIQLDILQNIPIPASSGFLQSLSAHPLTPLLFACYHDKAILRIDLSMPQTKSQIPLRGHSLSVEWVAFGENLNILLSASKDCTARSWDIYTSKPLKVFRGHKISLTSVAPLSQHLFITSSWDNTLKVWDQNTGKALRTLYGHLDTVWCLTVLQRKPMVASGGWDHDVIVWDWSKGMLVRRLKGHLGVIWSLCALQKDEYLASGSQDSTIKIWNWKTGEEVRTLGGHCKTVSTLFALKGDLLLSASCDCDLRIWKWTSGEVMKTINTKEVPSWSICKIPWREGLFVSAAHGNKECVIWQIS